MASSFTACGGNGQARVMLDCIRHPQSQNILHEIFPSLIPDDNMRKRG